MNKNEFNYIEIIQNDPSNRGNIVQLPEEHKNYTLDYNEKEVVNGYHSVYMFPKDISEYKASFNSIRGYDGPVYCNYLYWDMDNSSIEKAQRDTIELVERLLPLSSNIKIYFSGNKGFHILLFTDCVDKFIEEKNFNNKIKNICFELARGLESFDTRIYDKTRIFRTPNSKHSVTGFYKIEITYDELKSLTSVEIKKLAEKQRKIVSISDFTMIVDSDELTEIITKASEENTSIKERGMFNASELLNGIVYGFESGKRNNAYASIAGMLHSRNISQDFIRAILYSINSNSKTGLPETEIDTIVSSISRYKVDEAYEEKTSKDILTIEDAGLSWLNNIDKSGEFSLGERYKHINDVMNVTLLGDLVGIVSNSGVGKSTLTLDFANSYAQVRNKYSLFVSLEMASHACFFRAATISYIPDENGEVDSKIVAKNLVKNIELRKEIYKDWNRMLFVDKGSIPLEKIEEFGFKANELCGGNLGSLVIDYSQYIDGASDIDQALYIARETKGIIKRLNVIGFLAIQCNKSMPDSYTEVQDSHVEGVKAVKQACDYMMAFWKSRSESNKRLHGKFLKTRWGRDDVRFDLLRNGLKYTSVDELKESGAIGFGL